MPSFGQVLFKSLNRRAALTLDREDPPLPAHRTSQLDIELILRAIN